MSDILIKSMEMPKNCDECWKKYHGFGMVEHDEEWGTFYCKLAKGFCSDPRTKCPLVPVPSHGDLIDRDAPYKEFERNGWFDNADRDIAEDMLLDAPTIIPAEEGE